MLQIITDSSADLTLEEAKALGIQIVPLSVIFGDKGYLDLEEMTKEEFSSRLSGGEFPHTSQPAVDQFTEVFAKTNGRETLVLLISSALSGTVNSANIAKRDGGFTNVHVYDSLCTTAMLRLMVETAYRNRDKSAQEVVAILDELRPRIRLYAYLDTLEYLYKGGRIKKSVAIVGGLLGIKPIIQIPSEGTVVMAGKAHGQKKALKALADYYKAAAVDENYPVYFLRSTAEEPAREAMALAGRNNDPLIQICCAVGTHIGPNAAGIVFVERK